MISAGRRSYRQTRRPSRGSCKPLALAMGFMTACFTGTILGGLLLERRSLYDTARAGDRQPYEQVFTCATDRADHTRLPPRRGGGAAACRSIPPERAREIGAADPTAGHRPAH